MRGKKKVWAGVALVTIAALIAIPLLVFAGGGSDATLADDVPEEQLQTFPNDVIEEPQGYTVEVEAPKDTPCEEPDEPCEEPNEPCEEPDEPCEEPDEPCEEPDEDLCFTAWEYRGTIDPGMLPIIDLSPDWLIERSDEFTDEMYVQVCSSDDDKAVTNSGLIGPSLQLYQYEVGYDMARLLVEWEGYSDSFRNTGLYLWNVEYTRWIIVDKTWIPETSLFDDDDTLRQLILKSRNDDYVDNNGNLTIMVRPMLPDLGCSNIYTDYMNVTRFSVDPGESCDLSSAWEHNCILDPGILDIIDLSPDWLQERSNEFTDGSGDTCDMYAAVECSDDAKAITTRLVAPSIQLFEFDMDSGCESDCGRIMIRWEGYSDSFRNTGLYLWNVTTGGWVLVEKTWVPETSLFDDDDALSFVLPAFRYDNYVEDGKLNVMARPMLRDIFGPNSIRTDYISVTKYPDTSFELVMPVDLGLELSKEFTLIANINGVEVGGTIRVTVGGEVVGEVGVEGDCDGITLGRDITKAGWILIEIENAEGCVVHTMELELSIEGAISVILGGPELIDIEKYLAIDSDYCLE